MGLPEYRNEPFVDFSQPQIRAAMEEGLRRVEGQLGREYPLWIGGREVAGRGPTFASTNPSKPSQVIGTFHTPDEAQIDEAVQVATEAFRRWREVPPEERSVIFMRAAQMMRRNRYDYLAWLILEVGKNWVEAEAEVAEAIDHFEWNAREILKFSQPQPVAAFPGEFNQMIYIPLGPGVVIPPWNYPYGIAMGMSLAAIAAGNTVILKPASDAAALGHVYARLMKEAGLPDGVLNVLPGSGGRVGEALATHPGVRWVGFTGSKEVGCHLYRLAAEVRPGQRWLKRVLAELGGKNAAIVDTDSNLEYVADQVIAGAFGYQGQKCSATSRVVIVGDRYGRFIDMLAERIAALSIGPARENAAVGPLINRGALQRVQEYVRLAHREGRHVVGGEVLADRDGWMMRPALFADVDPGARVAQEEIFGPVLVAIRASSFEQAVDIANATEYGLTGSVFTLDPLKIAYAKKYFHAGNLYINRKTTGAWIGAHPFGGYNMSGTDAKLGGPDYLLYFLQAKTISERYA